MNGNMSIEVSKNCVLRGNLKTFILFYFIFELKTLNQQSNKLQLLELLSQFTGNLVFYFSIKIKPL